MANQVLVDMGSVDTIRWEDMWKEAIDIGNLEPPLSPVIAV